MLDLEEQGNSVLSETKESGFGQRSSSGTMSRRDSDNARTQVAQMLERDGVDLTNGLVYGHRREQRDRRIYVMIGSKRCCFDFFMYTIFIPLLR